MSQPTKEIIRGEAYSLGRTDVERAVMAAILLFENGYNVDEKCPRCGSSIEVEGLNAGREFHTVWISKCPCGACNSTMKGL
jgi:hypothetical protein